MVDRVLISVVISVAACAMTKFPRLAQRMGEPTKYISIDHTKSAGLPSSNSTRSFWVDSSPDASPLAREGSTGLFTTDADVPCITGSGVTGVGVAYHLSQTVEMTFSRRETFLGCPPYFRHCQWMVNEVVSDLLSGAGATGELIYRPRSNPPSSHLVYSSSRFRSKRRPTHPRRLF